MSTVKININQFKFFIKTSRLWNLVNKQNLPVDWISKLHIWTKLKHWHDAGEMANHTAGEDNVLSVQAQRPEFDSPAPQHLN